MAASQAELESLTTDLTTQAFETFAEDISTMFDTEVTASQTDITVGTIADIKDKFKKLAAVCSVTAQGEMNGRFHTIFDKEGLFTLAGTFVMQPAQIITKNRKNGTEDEAKEIEDALSEVGNLMVGAWDRAFREENEDHGHFVQSGTFIGNPWAKPKEKIGLEKDEELLILEFEMTVDPLDSFKCAVIYPKTIFESPAESEAEETTEEAPEEEAAEEAAQEDAAEETPAAEAAQEETAEQAPAAEATQEEAPAAETDTAEQAPEPEAQEADIAGDTDATQEDTQSEPVAAEPEQPPAPEPTTQPGSVSDAIRNITQSTAVLPGQPPDPAGLLTAVKVSTVMRADVLWAGVDETVEQLVAKMQQHDCGYVMVGASGVLEGIVSKSDIRGAMSPYLQTMFAKWRSPMDVATLQIKAQWVMSRPVRTVRPDATLWNVVKTMTDYGVRCLPVVDADSKVKGTVTAFDVFNVLLCGSDGVQTSGQTSQAPPLA